MQKILVFLCAFLLSTQCAMAQFSNAPRGPYQGSTVVPGTSGNVMTSNGTAWTSAAAAGGGGGSPFVPAGFAKLTTFGQWGDGVVVAPAGDYVYVGGNLLSNGDVAIAKIKISDGSITATWDSGTTSDRAQNLAISPDGAHVFCTGNIASTDWWDVATSGMTTAHHSTLAVAIGGAGGATQPFDLSPDGTIYAYVAGTDDKLYMINTSTYVVTNQTMNHTAGNLTAVCFYNGSNTDVYVAHAASADVDKYVIGGAYDSTVSTGAGGTPNFTAMRSGINGSFFIADHGTNEIIAVNTGTPTLYPVNSIPGSLCTNYLSPTAINDGEDVCYFNSGSVPMCVDYDFGNGLPALFAVPAPQAFIDNGIAGLACAPNTSQNLFTLGGVNYPELWSFAPVLPDILSTPNTAGNLKTSDGKGNWLSAAPYFTSADQTITAAGALTLAHGLSYTPGQVWMALVNQSTEAGYTAGQVVFVGGSQTVSVVAVQNEGYSAIVDATNLTIRYGSDASTFTVPHATTGAATAITNNKWKARFYAH